MHKKLAGDVDRQHTVMWGTPNGVTCLSTQAQAVKSRQVMCIDNTQRCHLPHLLTVRQSLVVTKQATYFADCHANNLLLLVVVIVLDGLLSML